MLVSGSGCSSHSTLFLVSMTCAKSCSAPSHRPWSRYADARLIMLVSVSGCSSPSTLFLVSMTCAKSCSAPSHRPSSKYVDTRAFMLINVSGCSTPSTLSRLHNLGKKLLEPLPPAFIQVCRCKITHADQRVWMLQSQHLLSHLQDLHLQMKKSSRFACAGRGTWGIHLPPWLLLISTLTVYKSEDVWCRGYAAVWCSRR